MKDNLNALANENMIIESSIYIEDTRFSIISDRGFLNRTLPKNHVYSTFETTPFHFHSFYEMVYTFSPHSIKFENETKLYEEGYLIIIPPGVPHIQQYVKHSNNDSGHKIPVMTNFFMKKFASVPEFSLYKTLTKLFSAPVALKIPERAGEIIKLFDSSEPNTVINDRFMASQVFHELVTLIMKSLKTNLTSQKNSNVTDSNITRSYMISMLISNFYSTDITVEQIAVKMKMSTRQVSRIINSMYGKTFREAITELRMKRAEKLLLDTEMNIAEISSTVGYNAVKGFYNAFKKNYGCLPTDYRKNNQTKEVNSL